jgi:anti-sigma B factor antagonist
MTGVEFSVRRVQQPAGTVLQVAGELDVATVAALRGEVVDAMQASPGTLLLDLSWCVFLDSTGCRELVRAAKTGAQTGTAVALVVPPENWRVRKVLDLMRFGELLPVYEAVPPA